jgi:hypothetical protein
VAARTLCGALTLLGFAEAAARRLPGCIALLRAGVTLSEFLIHSCRYPVALSCKHVYNWQTVAAKKGNGDWQLVKCAVAGCRGGANGGCGSAPSTLEARKALKEDPRIKNLLQVCG